MPTLPRHWNWWKWKQQSPRVTPKVLFLCIYLHLSFLTQSSFSKSFLDSPKEVARQGKWHFNFIYSYQSSEPGQIETDKSKSIGLGTAWGWWLWAPNNHWLFATSNSCNSLSSFFIISVNRDLEGGWEDAGNVRKEGGTMTTIWHLITVWIGMMPKR